MQLRQPLNLRKPLQMTAHKIRPTLNLPFAASGSLGPLITYTGQNGTYFNSSGTLTAATTDVARFDYNPSTLAARGLLIEEARTNSLRNNTMVGAVAGTPGTAPTNWIMSAASGNLTALNVIGTGTENGISYIDLRWITSGAINDVLVFEQTTQIVAADTQTWTGSQYCKLVGGSLTNVALGNRVQFRTAAGASVSTSDPAFVPTSASLSTQRNITTLTASGGTIARVTNGILLTFSGAADVTLRIGMPQLELGAFATSVISTSSVAVTRAADLASITGANFTSFWNATQGTIVVGYSVLSLGRAGRIFSADDGSTNNMIDATTTVGNLNLLEGFSGGVYGAGPATANTITALSSNKVAVSYSTTDSEAISLNGGAVVTGTVANPASPYTTLRIGGQQNGAAYLNGWISSLQIYPVGLTSTQIQTLST